MHEPHRALLLFTLVALSLVAACAHSGTHTDGGMDGLDGSMMMGGDGSAPTGTCGPAGMACCAGNTCELGLRCSHSTCCVQANSSTACQQASDCCPGLTCTNHVCCTGTGATCTGSGDCCSGLVCSMGVCTSPSAPGVGPMGCGAAGAVCCSGFTCQSGHVCNATTGRCDGCGTMGMHCCDGATPCTDATLACNPMSGNCETAPDPRNRCGRIDGPCCADDRVSPGGTLCEGGLVCTSGMCSNPMDRGGAGQMCNTHGGCNAGNLCNHATNMCSPTPMSCGHDMMMCCDPGGGAPPACDGSEHCQFGTCSMCAGPSLSCVLGGLLPGQQCCNGSVCRPAPLIPRCCVGPMQACTTSLDCCGVMQCMGGMCQAGRMGSLCVDSSECAMGLTCQWSATPPFHSCQPDPMASCMPAGQMCSGSASCCQGFTCGVSHNATATMTPSVCCTAHDGACMSPDDCCGHMDCLNNICQCRNVNDTCFRDAECCDMGTDMTGTTGHLGCVAGECQIIDHCERPGSMSVACTSRTDCCYGLECLPRHNGDTNDVCCQQGGTPCQHTSDCCGTMTCVMGLCQCQAVGRPCANTSDCCGGAFCTNGTCGM